MPSWNDLLTQLDAQPTDEAKNAWLASSLQNALKAISADRGGRNVIFLGSAFLQKPVAPPISMMLTHEEINGLMAVIYGMDCSKGLTLVLHTPGGVINAAETIVSYLYSKFDYIEVIVPVLAMSAGSMISLAAHRIVMGRQSQLGPIDPQMPYNGRTISARAVVDQFATAKEEIKSDLSAAHAWAPVLQSMGPSLLKEAEQSLEFGERMVAGWLASRMCSSEGDPGTAAKKIAQHFNDASMHKSHGRRIDRDEARKLGVVVEDLEDNQTLQEHVLTAYHLATIACEKSPLVKFLWADSGRAWMKNLGQ